MWTFYYDVTQAAAKTPDDTLAFLLVGVLVALVVLAPPYLEKKRNESR
jgi:hypothetical protein